YWWKWKTLNEIHEPVLRSVKSEKHTWAAPAAAVESKHDPDASSKMELPNHPTNRSGSPSPTRDRALLQRFPRWSASKNPLPWHRAPRQAARHCACGLSRPEGAY